MEKMRELVQQSTSSSTQLAAAAEQMSKLSRALLDSMDRFVLDENYGAAARRHPGRRLDQGSERNSPAEYAEAVRS
jgi:hypothetical protein